MTRLRIGGLRSSYRLKGAMKLNFKEHPAPFEHIAGPPLKKTVLEGGELEEVHERMRKWLKENTQQEEA